VEENTVVNNDVGISPWNANSDPSCTVASGTRTDDVVIRNRISDSEVTNTSGDTNPACGYQAGVQELGNHDVIAFNEISGKGYADHPTCTTAQPYVTFPIDSTGSVDPLVYFNF
jgi:hypothetical protein